MPKTARGSICPASSIVGAENLFPRTEQERSTVDVSLVVPMHNSTQFLSQLFASLDRLSTFPRQIIFHDDASSDGSLEAAKKMLTGFSWAGGVEVISSERNLGIAGSYNTLVARASSSWIHILDADDWFAGDFYRELDIKNVGGGCVAVVGGACCNQRIVNFIFQLCSRVLGRRHLPPWLPILGLMTTRSAIVYRTDVLRRIPFSDPAYDGSDIVHLLEIHKKGAIAFSPTARIGYRLHGGSSTDRTATFKYREELRRLAPGGLFLVDFFLRKRLFSFLRHWR